MGMLLLILDGKTALAGARTGVMLCLSVVIPALFPFIALAGVLMGASFGVLRPLGALCRMPKGAETLLIPAFLGGYPVGAQSVAQAWRQGQLTKGEAEGLLAFCCNAGPSFLFGMVASMFPSPRAVWALWAIHVISAVAVARLLPSDQGRTVVLAPREQPGLSQSLSQALRVMGLICGWVVLFRVVIAFLQRWVFFFLPVGVQVTLMGLLELTNGCCALPALEDVRLRFTVCSGLLAAGGLCVLMQTLSVTDGLSRKRLLQGKALQTAFSLAFCGCLFWGRPWMLAACLLLLPLPLLNRQKKSGIPAEAGI